MLGTKADPRQRAPVGTGGGELDGVAAMKSTRSAKAAPANGIEQRKDAEEPLMGEQHVRAAGRGLPGDGRCWKGLDDQARDVGCQPEGVHVVVQQRSSEEARSEPPVVHPRRAAGWGQIGTERLRVRGGRGAGAPASGSRPAEAAVGGSWAGVLGWAPTDDSTPSSDTSTGTGTKVVSLLHVSKAEQKRCFMGVLENLIKPAQVQRRRRWLFVSMGMMRSQVF